jgi:hypothetical protein
MAGMHARFANLDLPPSALPCSSVLTRGPLEQHNSGRKHRDNVSHATVDPWHPHPCSLFPFRLPLHVSLLFFASGGQQVLRRAAP